MKTRQLSFDRCGLPMSGALAVGIGGVVLASLALARPPSRCAPEVGKSQAAGLRAGQRRHGHRTRGILGVDLLKGLASQRFSRPIVVVTVANVGRQSFQVAGWELKSGLGASLYRRATGSGRACRTAWRWVTRPTWATDMESVQAPQWTEVVGGVELADGRPKLSQRLLAAVEGHCGRSVLLDCAAVR
jgi:hypothetical protein